MKLNIGQQSSPLQIDSCRKWNPTGIDVAEGEEYTFTATGEWTDFTIRAGPRGYATKATPALSRIFLSIFEQARRMPSENWFVLIGTIGENESTAFPIGDTLQNWRSTGMGELTCFANDVWAAYFNNHGSITLTVTRIK